MAHVTVNNLAATRSRQAAAGAQDNVVLAVFEPKVINNLLIATTSPKTRSVYGRNVKERDFSSLLGLWTEGIVIICPFVV